MKKALYLLVCSTVFSAPMPLKEVLKTALAQSPVLKSIQANVEIAELEQSNKKSSFFPSLDAETSIGVHKKHLAELHDPFDSSASLKLSENLYDNGKSIYRFQQSKLISAKAILEKEQAQNKLLLSTAIEFIEYTKNKKLLEAKTQLLEIIEKQNTKTEKQFKDGLKSKRDYLRVKTNYGRSVLDVKQAETTLFKIKENIIEAAAINNIDSVEFEITLPPSGIENTVINPIAVENTFEYKISNAAIAIKKIDTNVQNRTLYPELDLSLSAFYGNAGFIGKDTRLGANENYGLAGGLTVKYNFWDWGIRRRETEKLKVAEKQADYDLEKTKRSTLKDTRQLILNLQILKELQKGNEELFKNESISFNLISRDFQDGTIPYTDYSQALATYLETQIQLLQNKYQLWENVLQYHYYTGTLYATLLD